MGWNVSALFILRITNKRLLVVIVQSANEELKVYSHSKSCECDIKVT